MHPTNGNVPPIIRVKWTEPLNNVFARKGNEQQLRDINQIVDHGDTTVKDKNNKNKEMYVAASMHHQPLFAWTPANKQFFKNKTEGCCFVHFMSQINCVRTPIQIMKSRSVIK